MADSCDNNESRKQREMYTLVTPRLFNEEDGRPDYVSMVKSSGIPLRQPVTKTFYDNKYGKKNVAVKRFWMFSINFYDFLGLMDISPCGTLHTVQPYISYKMKTK